MPVTTINKKICFLNFIKEMRYEREMNNIYRKRGDKSMIVYM